MGETPVPRTTFRGFLFADLRGYSDFVERRGDHAGVALLTEYRQLVRSTVERYDGAEIRTEGDSFFVVFGSASRAVSCGMELVERAAQAEPPIHVGVGIHAGEAADTGEGPVGSAVNIAARVCAQAGVGELLVTDMVRALTRTLVPYRFVARGTPVLKGITEPVPVFKVVDAVAGDEEVAAPKPPRTTRQQAVARWSGPQRALGAMAVAAVVIVGSAAAAAALRPAGGANPTTAPTGTAVAAASATAVPSAAGSPPGATSTAAPGSTFASASPPASAATSTPVPSPSTTLTAAERDLVSRLAGLTADERSACRSGTAREKTSGAIASITCPLGPAADASSAHFDIFDQTAVLLTAFDAYLRGHGDPSADCASNPLGGGAWSVPRVAQGHVLCFVDAGTARILWTYEGGDGAGIMGSAERTDGDSKRLYAWWQEMHPLIAH